MSGAAVALILSGHDPGNLAASDEVAAAVVGLQFSTGEGPAIDAHHSRRAVLEPELRSATRWPAFGPEAVAAGAAALFALPLQVGAARIGALSLYCGRPGPLGAGVLTEALVMAEVACEITLRLQAEVPPGSLHEVLERAVLSIRRRAWWSYSSTSVPRRPLAGVPSSSWPTRWLKDTTRSCSLHRLAERCVEVLGVAEAGLVPRRLARAAAGTGLIERADAPH